MTENKGKGNPAATIHRTDMTAEMQAYCADVARDARAKGPVESAMAAYAKEQLDLKFGPGWH